MTDFSNFKIDIFQGINDAPVEPTATTGQNISYNNQKHNDLVNELEGIIDDLTLRIEDLEVDVFGSTGSNNGSDVFTASIPTGSGTVSLGIALPGFLSKYSIEGVTSSDDIELEINNGSETVGISNTQDFGTGIEYSLDSPSYELLANQNVNLVYRNISASKAVTIYLEYQ